LFEVPLGLNLLLFLEPWLHRLEGLIAYVTKDLFMRPLAKNFHFVGFLVLLLEHVLGDDQRAFGLIAEFLSGQALSPWVG
jgi:hypothetical protein